MTASSLTTLIAADGDAMRRIAGEVLAPHLRAGDVVILTGDLGAGKTTFTQGLGAAIGVRGPVASPTFIIARTHPSLVGGPALIHVDAYRLNSLAELDDLDLDTTVEDSITVVEWGEDKAEQLAADRVHVTIAREVGGEVDMERPDEGLRTVTIRLVGERWAGVSLVG
ncbi:tRNA (adenosine(37)-N6)-threonylcarbamoyltransferase complex ATPase subunit type 1 TsaE [Demequina sp. SYSU T00039]|uniref:tRNA threonylcarbamoyladenosine biosynthesis protein TsaE n=1 Tax=Demequina lignilytica TaxID=3051663 RepID=A0AAW7M8G7_9MICO|nr:MULTISPECIES: tRNA (adenosine(37)-N6)-threonylcarbamoyltransferase complex ATPase subunit type 1 TsaE [unclassified Demequina]MDN4478147.1 tRNA (adenosine(37)-N6)-threonylcarbamoyltransferase complex ATPase subunit type 1 TsaE [Demequina sp. SYSU T00039-1]MDN4488403.1 tRNA (adenosine(37)-N6)-threonylcarbamoyltransferase complex ATPase subunit type 1 TsaE [Demequina sp. SYSU T00039]MDN4490050.1 tRNA (adenosine(37)-N6)-threonylcarbamoyltransferase complex ATPase subunit type 1 TsaE [Demequina s